MIIKFSRDYVEIIRFGTCKKTALQLAGGGWCVFIDEGGGIEAS